MHITEESITSQNIQSLNGDNRIVDTVFTFELEWFAGDNDVEAQLSWLIQHRAKMCALTIDEEVNSIGRAVVKTRQRHFMFMMQDKFGGAA